jgi:hypothetical protein
MSDKLLNIGPKSAAWLRQVGIRTLEDLHRLGPVDAFLKVKRAGFRPSLNLLYALAGAIDGCHWAALSAERKSELVLDASAREEAAAAQKRFVMPARDVTPPRASEPEPAAVPEPGVFDSPDAGDAGETPSSDGGSDGATSGDA